MGSKTPTRFGSLFNKKVLQLTFVLVILLGLSSYLSRILLIRYHESQKQVPKNPQVMTAGNQIDALSRLIELPTDENPTVASISDTGKLEAQEFFKKAQNGDIVFAYPKNKLAILYRPGIQKIVKVAPIVINNKSNQKAAADDKTAEKTIRVAYLNGTETAGLAKATEKTVKEKNHSWQTVLVGDANKKGYKKTIIVDLTGNFGSEANQLAETLSGQVGNLPEGESKPDADIIIIVGK